MNITEPLLRICRNLDSLIDDVKELKEDLNKVNQNLDNLKKAINKHEEECITKEHEKKYRPYSLNEWIEQHEIGDIIHYRSKNGTELRHMYLGTRHRPEYKMLTLGDSSYSLNCLFEEYEIEVDGDWKPFGVLEEL